MKPQSVFAVIICAALQVSCTYQHYNLDLEMSLKMFEDCSVHLVLHDFEADKHPVIPKPSKFPLVISRRRYRLSDHNGLNRKDKCRKESYTLRSGNRFLFRSTPSPRRNCFVQVLIDPYPCLETTSNLEDHKRFSDPTLLDTILDYRFENTEQFRSWRRCCIYYIQVKSVYTVTPQDILTRMKIESIHLANSRAGGSAQLLFVFEFSKDSNSYKVTETSVLTCSDDQKLLDLVSQVCKAYLDDPFSIYNCFLTKFSDQAQPECYEAYRSEAVSRKLFNKIRMKHCFSGIITYIGNINYNRLSDIYFRNWNAKELDVEVVLLNIMFPNYTLTKTNLISKILTIPQLDVVRDVNPTVLASSYDAVHFVTCVPISKPTFLSLAGFINAFDLRTWLMTLITLTISLVVLYKSGSLARIMLFYCVLTGQSTPAIDKVRWLTGAWVLAGLFLTINYQGSNIDSLTSPLDPKKIESFEELFSHNLTLFSLPLEYEMLAGLANTFESGNDTEAFGLDPIIFAEYSFLAKLYVRTHPNLTLHDATNSIKLFLKTPNSVMEGFKMFHISYYIENLSKCENNSFVDSLSYVERVRLGLKRLRINDKTIATSILPLGQIYQTWKFIWLNWPLEIVKARTASIIESGLNQMWTAWKQRVETWSDVLSSAKTPAELFKSVSIEGNVVVIFYVHLVFLAGSVFIFVYECKMNLLMQFMTILSLLATTANFIDVKLLASIKHLRNIFVVGYRVFTQTNIRVVTVQTRNNN